MEREAMRQVQRVKEQSQRNARKRAQAAKPKPKQGRRVARPAPSGQQQRLVVGRALAHKPRPQRQPRSGGSVPTNKVVAALLAPLVDPANHSPLRCPIKAMRRPTAVAKLSKTFTPSFSAYNPAGTPQYVLPGEMFIAMLRSPLRSMLYSVHNANATAHSYTATWGISGNEALKPYYHIQPMWQPAFPTSTFQPHGPIMFPGRAASQTGADRFGFWISGFQVNSTLTITVNVSAIAVAGNIIARSWYCQDSLWLHGPTTIAAAIVGAVVLNITVNQDGYWGVDLETDTADCTVTSATYSYTSTGPTIAHLCSPQLETNYANIQRMRINAHSILASDVANLLSRNGSILARRVPGDESWVSNCTFAQLSPLADRQMLKADKGAYMILQPDTDVDFEFVDISNTNGICLASYTISPSSAFNVLVVQVVEVGGTYPGGIFSVQDYQHVEFTTDLQWFDTSVTSVPLAISNNLLDELGAIAWLYDNPLHIADIKRFLSRVATSVIEWAPKVISGIQTAATVAAHVAPFFL